MKLKTKDSVIVIAGKDRGRKGKIDRIYAKQNKVLIQGINVYKKHVKKSEKTPQGGVVELARPIDVSKISLLCSGCKKPTRIGYKIEGKNKIRVCRKCGDAFNK